MAAAVIGKYSATQSMSLPLVHVSFLGKLTGGGGGRGLCIPDCRKIGGDARGKWLGDRKTLARFQKPDSKQKPKFLKAGPGNQIDSHVQHHFFLPFKEYICV